MIDSSPDGVICAAHPNNAGEAASSVDAVRCLYLAKIVERHGHPQAARRWEARAQRWLKRMTAKTGRPTHP